MQFDVDSYILNRYRIVKLLNEGGMSYIYLVEDIKLHQRKAVFKLMKTQYSKQNYLIEKEAETLIGLNHANLPQIYDIFLYEQFPVIVMEYVDGIVLSQTSTLGMEQKLHILEQLCEVMCYLHHRPVPILHCDLKPNNIMIDEQLNIKLIDFGISSYELVRSEHYLKTVKVEFGTPMYMAPEIIKGERPTTASDLYSFGLIILFMWGKEKQFLQLTSLSVEQFIENYVDEIFLPLKDIVYFALQSNPKNRKYSFYEMKKQMNQWSNVLQEVKNTERIKEIKKNKHQIIAVLNLNKCAGATTIATILSQVLMDTYKDIACVELSNEDANLCKSYLGVQVSSSQLLFGYRKVSEGTVNYYFDEHGQSSVDVVNLQRLFNQLEEECVVVDFSTIPDRFSLLHYLGELNRLIVVSDSDIYLCNNTQIVNVINNLRSYSGNIVHINNKVIEKEHCSFLQKWINISEYCEIPYFIERKPVKCKALGKWLHPKVKMSQLIRERLKRLF